MTEPLLRVLAALALLSGTTLVLSSFVWFSQPRLPDRLTPYIGGVDWRRPPVEESWSGRITAAVVRASTRLAAIVRINGQLERCLRRTHRQDTVGDVRIRQLGWGALTLSSATAMSILARPAAPLVLALLVAGPVLAMLIVEHQIRAASSQWQERLTLELPVATEQLAMLVDAGWSTQAAVGRIATRGHGACAADFRRVMARIGQGCSERDALREWSELAEVPAVDRLVGILTLQRQTNDLSRLLTDESATVRAEATRALMAVIEKRTQQVWIPVTVATLIPGVALIGVPFVDALSLFTRQ